MDARTEFKILEPLLKGGVEAGRAHHCKIHAEIQLLFLSNRTIKDENFGLLREARKPYYIHELGGSNAPLN